MSDLVGDAAVSVVGMLLWSLLENQAFGGIRGWAKFVATMILALAGLALTLIFWAGVLAAAIYFLERL